MNHISWIVFVAGLLMASSAILANMLSFVMIGKLNERLSEQERISYLWWGTEVQKRFAQLYPGSGLVRLLDCCVVIMVICFIALIRFWVFG